MKFSYVLAVLSGGLFSIGFAPFNLWPLSIISLVIYIYLLRDLAYLESFKIGFLYGFGLWLVGISWLYVSIHFHGNLSVIYSLLITLLFIFYLSIYMALQALLFRYLKNKTFSDALIAFPSTWLLFEIIRGSWFSGFPWLIAGTAIGDSYFDGWIPLIGATGTSLFMLILAGSLFLLIDNLKRKVSITLPFVIFFISLLSGYLLKEISWTSKAQVLDVSVYQPNLTLKQKWSYKGIEKTKSLIEKAIHEANNYELIIFPETALILNEDQQKEWLDKIHFQASAKHIGLITGIIERGLGEESNELSKISNRLKGFGLASGFYDKIQLVPFGEYIPLSGYIGKFLDILDLKLTNTLPGTDINLIRLGEIYIAPSICYEIAFSNLIRKSAIGSTLLVTISNDSWFGSSIGPYQHLEIAQNRAIEHQKGLIRSTNSGISAIIDKKGRIIKKQGFFEEKSLNSQVYSNKGTTPFAQYGNIPIYFYLIISFTILIIKRKQKFYKI